jgi:Flp pilus assembly protein TadB
MTLIMLAGALAGLGVFTLVWQLDRGTGTGAAELARLDAARQRVRREAGLRVDRSHETESLRMRRLGAALENRGWRLPAPVRADLAVMGSSVESHLASTVMTAVAGFFAPTIMLAPAVYFFGTSWTTPLWLDLIGVLVAGLLPTAQLRSAASDRRRDFRHVVSVFLDLVAMNLAGGRGVPEALGSAAAISDGWGMVRIRDTLQTARLQGITPWAALGELGDEMAVEELRDLAATLALVAEDGAKVRDSLAARAASMRQRELADAEGRAAARSQSMLIAQLLLCVGFLLFPTYPAVARILGM